MAIELACGLIGVAASFAAAGFWLWASLARVRNSIDHIHEDLLRQSRLNAYGAFAACVAAMSAGIMFLWSV